MNLIILLLFAITASLASEVKVEKRWSKLEKSTLMECIYEKPVDYCLWATPYQPVMAFNSVTEQEIEDGRLKSIKTTTNSVHKCSLYINKVDEKDEGKWTCYGNDNKENTKREHKTFNLSLLANPLSVFLDNPFEKLDNDTAMESKQELSCTAENLVSTPVFSWFLEDTPLEFDEVNIHTKQKSDHTWINTFTYQPVKEDSKKSLKCVVEQSETNPKTKTESVEASIILSFTEENIEAMVDKPVKEIIEVLEVFDTPLAVFIVCCITFVFGICGMIFVCHNKKWCCFKVQVDNLNFEVDGETGNGHTNGLVEQTKDADETETEKADSVKEEKVSTQELNGSVRNKSFGDRFASFFRMNKNNEATNEKENVATDTDGLTDVVIDNKLAEEKNNAEETNKNNESATISEPIEKEVKSNFRTFFVKLFKPRDTVADKKSEEPVKMTDCETKDELEPEDKPELFEEAKIVKVQSEPKLTEPKEEKAPSTETSF